MASSKVHGVKAKKIVNYMVMPGIMPRARRLFTSGFAYIAFLMANIYGMVRLLPPGHVYLNPANIGKFGIRHVIAEAADHIVIRKENIDQLVIFAAMLAGTVLLILQFVLLLWSLFVQHAQAAGLFNTVAPANDIAFMLLDHVFGVPGLFNSCVATGAVCAGATVPFGPVPFPFHDALHSLFAFYSTGLLMIAILIFLYFLVVVIVETASTGTPFGKRFQHIWVPIRLVVALALLVPITFGLNSGQYIALYAAKLGSGFATNAWQGYNDAIAANDIFAAFGAGPQRANPLGERLSLIALPKQQDASIMTGMMSLIHTCAYSYWRNMPRTGGGTPAPTGVLHAAAPIKPYFVKTDQPYLNNNSIREEVTAGTNYIDALEFYDYSDIIIRFGKFDPALDARNVKGQVEPLCGEVRIRVGDVARSSTLGFPLAIAQGGAEFMLYQYFELMKRMWFNDVSFQQFALRAAEVTAQNQSGGTEYRQCGDDAALPHGCGNGLLPSCAAPQPCIDTLPSAEWKQDRINTYQGVINASLVAAWTLYSLLGAETEITNDVMLRGWAGAGIWYNKVAQYNGAFVTSVMDTPALESYPWVMEKVRDEKRREDAEFDARTQFSPNLSDGQPVEIEGGNEPDLEIAKIMDTVYQYWTKDGLNQLQQEKATSGNIITDTMHAIFGTSGLFDIRNENAHTHPLAALVAVGKALVESTIRNIGIATAFSFGGGLLGIMSEANGQGITGFLVGISFLGLTAGIVLFYVLPFLPFVYFYFAVGTWVKSIFEAMVGVPLWALAHLRLDGNGLPGDSAQQGYFLIFEIFVRPILTVFGLIAAIVIFGAQVRILNFIWDLVTQNLAGFNQDPTIPIVAGLDIKRGIVDQFFFTIIYTIVVYMLATASFKLIDRIPDDIMRWMGAGVSSYGDINKENVEGLSRYVGTGGMVFGQQITRGITGAAGQAGTAIRAGFQGGGARGRLGGMIDGGGGGG